MHDTLKARLAQLQQEQAVGHQRVTALQQDLANLQTALLRIEGACLLIEELLKTTETPLG